MTNNLQNGLVRHRPAYICDAEWERMIQASPIDLAMRSVLWERDLCNPTLWTVLSKHPDVINKVAYNNRTLLCQAIISYSSNCMWRLVQFGAEFSADDAKRAMRWDASRHAYERREEIRADARSFARTKTEFVDGEYI